MILDPHEIDRIRNLWAAVAVSVVDDFRRDFRKAKCRQSRNRVAAACRRYWQSASGQELLSLAGHEPGGRGVDALVAASRDTTLSRLSRPGEPDPRLAHHADEPDDDL